MVFGLLEKLISVSTTSNVGDEWADIEDIDEFELSGAIFETELNNS